MNVENLSLNIFDLDGNFVPEAFYIAEHEEFPLTRAINVKSENKDKLLKKIELELIFNKTWFYFFKYDEGCYIQFLVGYDGISIKNVALFAARTETLDEMEAFIYTNIRSKYRAPRAKNGVRFINITASGSYTLSDPITPFNKKEAKDFIENNYNDDFQEVNGRVLNDLQKGGRGLYLFHGKPGTGKSTYLRYLAHKLKKRPMIFLPSSSIEIIAQPAFITFMSEQCKGAVLFIEDAENILTDRSINMSQAVPNLLNVTDGLMGDLLELAIICTFNQNLSAIDKALLRKGRTREMYEFKELSLEKCKKLNPAADKAMVLADLYNMEEESFTKTNNKIGFSYGN